MTTDHDSQPWARFDTVVQHLVEPPLQKCREQLDTIAQQIRDEFIQVKGAVDGLQEETRQAADALDASRSDLVGRTARHEESLGSLQREVTELRRQVADLHTTRQRINGGLADLREALEHTRHTVAAARGQAARLGILVWVVLGVLVVTGTVELAYGLRR